MKILAVSDRVSPIVYSESAKDRYADVDLVIGCGDLPFYYLEFITTVIKAPVVYVYGNHDVAQLTGEGVRTMHAEGCELIDGQLRREKGLLLAGLGGSPVYNRKTPHQHTESMMIFRMLWMLPGLLYNRIFRGRFLDILVTHSPMRGLHDAEDVTHRGFRSLRLFVKLFKPRLMLHGHVHIYRNDKKQVSMIGKTKVVNVYPVKHILWEDLTVK